MDNTAQFTHLPRAITVETTATCQLRCPACPTPHTVGRSRGFFTTQLLAQLLGQIDWPLESISFGWSGEPLLNRDLSKMIALASPRGTTYVSTNGLLLERDSDALLDSGLHHLRVCLDGIDQQMGRVISGGCGLREGRPRAEMYCRKKGQTWSTIPAHFLSNADNKAYRGCTGTICAIGYGLWGR